MTLAVDLGRKATKQTNKQTNNNRPTYDGYSYTRHFKRLTVFLRKTKVELLIKFFNVKISTIKVALHVV